MKIETFDNNGNLLSRVDLRTVSATSELCLCRFKERCELLLEKLDFDWHLKRQAAGIALPDDVKTKAKAYFDRYDALKAQIDSITLDAKDGDKTVCDEIECLTWEA